MELYHKEDYDIYLSPEALRTLENHWRSGLLNDRIKFWKHFIRHHWEEIHRIIGPNADEFIILETAKAWLKSHGCLDLSSEMRDQSKAIQDEIWIRGEKGDFDRTKILLEWAAEHAETWRRWRIQENLFVADRIVLDLYREISGERGNSSLHC